ncbi:GNAT family N-acetyltransferase [Brucella sp. TWI432]
MIESSRLILRKPIASDFEAYAEMFSDPSVTAHIGGVLKRSESWARFLRDVGHWAVEDFGQYIIVEKATSAFVGKIGFAKFERNLGIHTKTSIEVTWLLNSNFHGLGYAKEAGIAVHRWQDLNNPISTACLIAENNLPSLKLAAHLGYEQIDILHRVSGTALVLERKCSI